jgi:hypothetical protein
MKNVKNKHVTNKQPNNKSCCSNDFLQMVEHGLKTGGIHIVASKSHGKSRLLFSIARQLRQKSRVIIFDGSETWIYGFDKISTFTIKERDIVAKRTETTDEIERYRIKNWNLIEFALQNYKHILFRLKTRKPSKRGFFIRQVVNYLDAIQRESRQSTKDNEARGYISYFIEEAQSSFTTVSTLKSEAEEFLTVFNEARNQREAFFTASQRLNDFSKTIRVKQTYCIGLIPEEDKTVAIRRLERKYETDFSKLDARSWCFEGKTFESPLWKQKHKPYQINKKIQQKYVEQLQPPQQEETKPIMKKKPTIKDKLKYYWSKFVNFPIPVNTPKITLSRAEIEDTEESTELNAIMAETDEEDEEFYW